MATHSSVLAWRIPGTGEPGGLPSMGSYRVRHDWSDLAAAGKASIVANVGGATLCSTSPSIQPLNRHWAPPRAIVNARWWDCLCPCPCPKSMPSWCLQTDGKSQERNAMLVIATSSLKKNGYHGDVSWRRQMCMQVCWHAHVRGCSNTYIRIHMWISPNIQHVL